MRILFVHNYYQRKGGEDNAFIQERNLLEQTEEMKILIFRNLPGLRGAAQFFFSLWNIRSAGKIRKAIKTFQPEIIHVHNWHYGIGPIFIRIAHKRKIPVVLTIHNFRLLCPSATLLYEGNLFLDSIHARFPWKAISKRLYRNSYLQTFWLSFIIWVHKKIGTWRMVDQYIVLTEMAKKLFVSSFLGVREEQFAVKPNFLDDPVKEVADREDYFLFVGRLSEEKGLEILLNAFAGKKTKLIIGGDGPMKSKVIEASQLNPWIQFAGNMEHHLVIKMMSRSTALIFPSIWYEGMPMTLIEAFATGTPVIASNLGAMASMVKNEYNGLHFTPGNAIELSNKIDYWEKLESNEKIQFSRNARSTYDSLYTPGINKMQLLSIYHSAIQHSAGLQLG
jgi:glycosyltransferase involved in cell wall biosynthesis